MNTPVKEIPLKKIIARPTNQPIVVAALYHFTPMPDAQDRQADFKTKMVDLGVKGTILVTPEGINGTISGAGDAIDAFLTYLKSDERFADLDHKESYMEHHPFERSKVKLKKETISIGEETNMCLRGHYVEAKDWNALINDPRTILVDTRNDYEYILGTFKGAINPKTRTFKQFPAVMRKIMRPFKKKKSDVKVAMFCTGGIRCEKSTSWLMQEGYDDVYHLKGGILKYLEDIPKEESLWQGDCYVFDDRVAVDHDLKPSTSAQICQKCGGTIIARDMTSPLFRFGEQCVNCAPKWQRSLNHWYRQYRNWRFGRSG